MREREAGDYWESTVLGGQLQAMSHRDESPPETPVGSPTGHPVFNLGGHLNPNTLEPQALEVDRRETEMRLVSLIG